MSIKRVAVGLTLCVAATVTLSVRADQPVNLAVEMGLWEVTTHPQMSGGIPPELQQQLQSMPAAQRERIEAAMQASMADAQRDHVSRECMTRKRLSRGFDTGDHSEGCKSTMVSNTDSRFEYDEVCHLQDGNSRTEKALFHMIDRHHVSGTVEIVQSGGGHSMSIHETVEGKWLSSSCGEVKDSEIVR